MEAIVNFYESDVQAQVTMETWAFKRLQDGSHLIEFYDEEERVVSFFPLTGVKGVDFSYE
jgi:hypothetical protein